MTTPTATVHIYRPAGAAPLRDEDLHRRQAAATRLLESCSVPPQRNTTAAFVQLHKPLQPSPSSKAYQAHPPDSLSPQKLRTSHIDPRAGDDRSPIETANLPSFSHWRPSSSSTNPPLLAPTPSLAPPTQQTQGTLRKRTTETTTAGAWAPAETREKKKKVRVELPRTTIAAAAAAAAGVIGGRRGARELVPATPEEVAAGKKEVGGSGKEDEEKEEPDLGKGAVERCIPYPYCHTSTVPCSDPNPARQHPARILHSFADPSFTSPSSTTNTLVTGGASLAQSHSLVRVNSGSSQLSQLAITSPATLAFLQPGRRGSWLVPISGLLPIPHTSPPRWFSRPPSSSTSTSTSPSVPLPIDWTDDRLRALWALLDSLHSSGGLGSLRVNCHIPPPSSSSSSSASSSASSSSSAAPPMPSYLKITTDAYLALPLRGVLNQLNVKAMLHSSSSSSSSSSRRRRKEGEEGGEDGEKFLKGRAIVWVDEMGRAVLTA